MATIKVKRSAVAGRVPATTDLELGEIAINTYDGVAYVKKNVSGTETVVQLGSANLSQNLQNRYQYTATAAQTTFSAVYLAPYVDVYLNGIRLIAGIDYTATNGTTVVLTTAASLNNTIDIVAYTSYTANANFADLISSHVTTALGYTPENPANRGVANGYASLNSSGQIPSAQLPSFVDDVLEYANLAALPATGESGKIYVTQDTNKTYRWSGSAYTEIASSPGSTDAVTEGSSNLYFTNARARNALSATQNLTYSSSTGVFTGPDLSGYLTSATAATVYAPLASPSFSGSVGIGTSSPAYKFDLYTTDQFSGRWGNATRAGYFYTDSGGPGIFNTAAYGGEGIYFHAGANYIQFITNSIESMRLNGSGNLGIGTTSPLGKLHISTTDLLSARKAYSGLGNTGAGDGIFEAYRLDGPLNYLRVLDIVSLGDSVNNRGSETRFFTTNTSGVTAERVKIDSSGNVGIATNDPRATVHIGSGFGGGNVPTTSKLMFGANNSIVTFLSANDGTSVDGEIGSWNTVYNHQNAKIMFDKPAGNLGQLSFWTQNGTGIIERLRINNAGAFGLSGANYGTTGQVLTSQGSGSAPIWAAAGGGGSQWTTTGSDIYYNTGNVGVGVAAPYNKLQVAGTIKTATTNQSGVLAFGGNTQSLVQLAVFRGAANSTGDGNYLNIAGYEGITFSASAANIGSQTEWMRISNTGNVGIGTNNPTTSKLQVSITNSDPVTSGISCISGAGVYPGTDNFVAGKFVSNHFGTSWGVWGESNQGGYGNCWGVYGAGGVVGGFSAGVHGLGRQQNVGGYGTACGGFFDAYASNQGPNGSMVGVYAKCTSVATSGCGQSSYAIRLETNLGPVSSYGALYVHNGSQVFTLNSNGGISNFSGNNVNLSDEREKKNITVAGNYLSKICAITVKTFNYNNDAEGEQVTLGVIAQEVEAVAPELVSESEWEYGSETNADGAPIALKRTRKGIYEADMMFAIMKSVQELNAKHEALKSEFDAYKASHP